MACAIEDAGFQIRDQIMWVYGSGFPKSLNIGKALDKVAGAEREVIGTIRNNQPGGTSAFAEGGVGSYQRGDTTERDIVGGPVTPEAEEWDGWGTALKPAHEPIVLARKPIVGTVANNVLTHGTGGINIDGCRVGDEVLPEQTAGQAQIGTFERTNMVTPERTGRFPANFIHDGSFDMNVTNNFTCTPTGTFTLTFTNITAGQSGYVLLVNTGGHAVSAASTTKVNTTFLTTVSAAGTYLLSYFSNGTNVYVTTGGAMA